jgi:RNA polymerase sigma-70 factor (ECF subfamily)
MEATDAAIVAEVLAGDREAFRLLVERHSRLIFRVAYRMTGDQYDAEEVVQETLLRAYKSLDRFELRSNFGTWVYRIATNCTLDLLRRKSHMKDTCQIADNPDPAEDEVQLAATSPGPERLLLSAELKRKLAQALELLTPTERVAFTMRHMEGQSIEEISRALDVKVSATKNSVFRAVQKLRQQLEPLRAWAPGAPHIAGPESGK